MERGFAWAHEQRDGTRLMNIHQIVVVVVAHFGPGNKLNQKALPKLKTARD